ncbi:homocysteine S-methyltransferase [Halobacillus sp. Marseille-P3879]|uniref:homocysteine S-methyltransferase n=1 Tax=Halobacillus sp. Marseille-P3879 TaxID=2045014 RepID=UPI000C7A8D08|nr:homocysteine S-methyltransferase [Halobacillus sp. Marseille-P3879]
MSLTKINPIKHILDHHSVLVLDGALATELEAYGCDLDDPLWSARILLEQPELISRVHYDYFKAGADCAITASYQATIDGFAQRGIKKKEAVELIKKTVELAREARDDFWQEEARLDRPKPIVAASVGPYGAYLADGSEYVGNYGISDEEVVEFHRPRVKALVEAGADVLAFETLPSFQEAKVLAALLEEFPDTYAWLSFTLKTGESISDGTPLQDCAEMVKEHPQITAIGINCSPVEEATSAISELRRCTDKSIIIYPNSGETYDAATNTWHGQESCVRFGRQSEIWYEAGARILGGCCRTSPNDIKAIADKWRSY